jgi:hypothetical protein
MFHEFDYAILPAHGVRVTRSVARRVLRQVYKQYGPKILERGERFQGRVGTYLARICERIYKGEDVDLSELYNVDQCDCVECMCIVCGHCPCGCMYTSRHW